MRKYLFAMRDIFIEQARIVSELEKNTNLSSMQQILKIIEKITEKEKNLRDQYEISNEQIKTIPFKLTDIAKNLEAKIKNLTATKNIEEIGDINNENEVFVYLFNLRGEIMQTWQSFLNESAVVQHNLNRPIYKKKEDIIKFISDKSNLALHGFLVIKTAEDNIINEYVKDGYTIIKLKSKSISIEKIVQFYHKNSIYPVRNGEIIF